MMSLKSKCELLEVVRPRYLKASKFEKQKILDELTCATGYHRKHAIRVLKNQGQVQNHLKRKTKTYQSIYRGEVVQVLEQIWEIYGRICSKRLQPILAEAIKVLERCKEIKITKETKDLLLKISSASIDRCLLPVRIKSPHGLSTTKPGSLLKNLIPVRTFTEWDEERPGFMEIDLVAHCGNTTEGQYLNTLTCTDISTGWTDITALLHRSQEAVSKAIHWMRPRLPLHVLAPTRKTIKPMSNSRIGPWCAIPLAVITGKPNRNSLSWKAFMMTQPRRLTSVYSNARIFL